MQSILLVIKKLKSYFYGFSVWNEDNVCLSWGLIIIGCIAKLKKIY